MSVRVRWLAAPALVLGLITVPATPAAASSTFTPVADSYVDASGPGVNHGTETTLRADAFPVRTSYLRFTVHDVGSSTSAVLRLHAETASRVGIRVAAVAADTWTETGVTYANAPAAGTVLDTSAGFSADQWLTLDVSGLVTGDGTYSLRLSTTDDTAIRISSRESAYPPVLLVPRPSQLSPFTISPTGDGYRAESATGRLYTGTLKYVGERAAHELETGGGGTIAFTAGTFDFGRDYFKFTALHDITFVGAGMDATLLRNWTDEAADTEPFNFTGATRIIVRDLAVSAGGPPRTTSDALDFDNGVQVLVERVKVTDSRARGIIFDGKNGGWNSYGNTVRDCVITGADTHGVELLASTGNTVQGCTITGVGGYGITVTKSSATADQPNKKANDNVVSGNRIDQAGSDGIAVNSSDRNQIFDNTVTNSSDDISGRAGIRLSGTDAVSCADNVVSGDSATDSQLVKTQRYGLNIADPLVLRTVVGPDDTFTGNLSRPVRDAGVGTTYR